MVPCWNSTATGDEVVLDVVMKRSFMCIIKHNICYYTYIAYIRREECFVCYLLICHEHKNADKSLSSDSKHIDVFALLKTAVKQRGQRGGTLSSYFQFGCCNSVQ